MSKVTILSLLALIGFAAIACTAISGCARPTRNGLALNGDIWMVDSLFYDGPGNLRSAKGVTKPSVEFMEDGQLSGTSFCGILSGRYKTEGRNLIRIDLEKKAETPCEEQAMETKLQEQFALIREYRITPENQLILSDSTGSKIMSLVPASRIQKPSPSR